VSNMGTILRSAEFIEHIANDILDVRRIEEGKIDIAFEKVDVFQLICGLQKTVKSLFLEKSDVQFVVDCAVDVVLVSDRYRLEQIIMNFLTNAFKCTDSGTVTLACHTTADNLGLRISVTDTGRGIREDKKLILFNQFAQVSVRDSAGGFGLGLFLSKMLAGLLGGTVGFESTLGVGSCFWIDLPFEEDQLIVQFETSRFVLQPRK
jgi:signal transduction histidine kinase